MKDYPKRTITRSLIFIVVICLIWFSSSYFKIEHSAIENFLSRYPLGLQFALFIFLYTVIAFFLWPIKEPLKIIGAIFYGAYISTILIFISELINCFIFFNFTRYIAKGSLAQDAKYKDGAIKEKVQGAGFIWLLLFRAAPLIPYQALDTIAALTKISFKRYLFVVLLGSPIRIFWIQYILSFVGDAIFKDQTKVVNFLINNKPFFWFSFLYIILVIIVAIKIRHRSSITNPTS